MNNKMTLPKKDVLVVFFCVSFLILCLGAMGAKGRYHSRLALCKLKQKQLSRASLIYANDNEGRFFNSNRPGLWIKSIADYIDNDEVRHCPETEKNPYETPLDRFSSNLYGNAKMTWIWNFGVEELEYGSFAFNGWLYSGGRSNTFRNLSEVQQPDTTPLFSDSVWVDSWPEESDTCPADYDLNGGPTYTMMLRLITNRHLDKTNVSFADGHVRSVELKQLWSLTWHKQWTPTENMTREDGSPIYQE